MQGSNLYTIHDVCDLAKIDKAHQGVVKRVLEPYRKEYRNGTKVKVDGKWKSFRVGYQFSIDPIIASHDDQHHPFGEVMVYTAAESQRYEAYRQDLKRYREVLAANGWNATQLATLDDDALLQELMCSDRRAGLYLLTKPPPDQWVGKCGTPLTIDGYLVYGNAIAVNNRYQLFRIQGKPFPNAVIAKNIAMGVERACGLLDQEHRKELLDILSRYIQRYPHHESSDFIQDITSVLCNTSM